MAIDPELLEKFREQTKEQVDRISMLHYCMDFEELHCRSIVNINNENKYSSLLSQVLEFISKELDEGNIDYHGQGVWSVHKRKDKVVFNDDC